MALNEAQQVLGIISLGGTICWGAWKYLLKPEIKKAKARKQEVLVKVSEIWSELKFNGGSSLKDVIYKTQKSVENIDYRMAGLEENQRLSMNLQGICYWISDEDGHCIYASPGLCKMLGRSESDLLENNWMAWVHPNDKDNVVRSWLFSVENKTAFDEIYRMKRSDGMYQKVWGVAFPKTVRNNFGGVMGKLTAIEEPVKA